MGVGIDDEGGAHFQGHPGHVAVGQAVAFAGRDFQKDAPLPGQGGFLQGDEAGVGQDVDVGLDGGPVGARGHRLRQGLAVDHDERHPQGPGLGGQRRR